MVDASNVVRLPDRASRSWSGVAEGLCEALVEMGRDPIAVAQTVEELRPIYIAAWEGPSIPSGADPNEKVEQVNAWVTGIVLRLLLFAAESKLDLKEAIGDGAAD